ncbi:MAG: DUF3048 domain-containing protein [Candidatus Caldatribacteriaceae bacterium]
MVFNEKRVWSLSLFISLIVNISVLAVVSVWWLSFRVTREEEKPVVVELLEIPLKKAPAGVAPQEVRKAELEPPKEIKEPSLEPPQVRSELSASVEQRREQVRIPKPPVDLPEAENIPERASPSGARLFTPGEELEVAEAMKEEGLKAETTIKAALEGGTSNLLARLAEEGLAEKEGMVGETLAEGELVPPTSSFERKSPFTRRPFAFAIENAPGARPQYGLSQANVVYEMLTEGGITRFLAVFYSGSPRRVGPIRSARPYFVLKSFEHDAILVHSGGSMEAYTYLRELPVDSIDEQKNFRPFERSRDRRPPHNLYALFSNLLEEAQRLGLSRPVRSSSLPVLFPEEKPGGRDAQRMEIRYSLDYRVQFVYDTQKGVYYRFINSEPHKDAESGQQISCSTIVVQLTEHRIKDEEGRVEIRFVGKGSGWIFVGGKVVPLLWEKNSFRDKTRFYLEDGKEAKIAPGQLWIEVVDTPEKVVF